MLPEEVIRIIAVFLFSFTVYWLLFPKQKSINETQQVQEHKVAEDILKKEESIKKRLPAFLKKIEEYEKLKTEAETVLGKHEEAARQIKTTGHATKAIRDTALTPLKKIKTNWIEPEKARSNLAQLHEEINDALSEVHDSTIKRTLGQYEGRVTILQEFWS